MEGSPGDLSFNIHLNSALQHIKLAKEAEQRELYEKGYNHFMQASNKLMDLLRQEQDEARKKIFVKHLNETIANAGFLKQIINDKKYTIKRQQENMIKPSTQPVGLHCLRD